MVTKSSDMVMFPRSCFILTLFIGAVRQMPFISAWKYPQASSTILTLPVFPLQKAVKFPTDEVTLNLFEERYLALADRVLYGAANDVTTVPPSMMFGAWYCSNRSQIVRNGVVSPLIEPGDVGVVCHVMYHHSSNGRNGPGRRVNIVGLAADRFRVERVLFNGFDNVDECPYIVVLATCFFDESASSLSADAYFNRLVWYEDKLCDQWNRNTIASSRRITTTTTKEKPSSYSLENKRKKSSQIGSFLEDIYNKYPFTTDVCSTDGNTTDGNMISSKKRLHELVSFALASAVLAATNSPSLQAEELLQLRCPLQRYLLLDKFLREKREKRQWILFLLLSSMILLLPLVY
mmetsp:Transcript_28025/g.40115  ORF Transcript_28025/g.40115 Transcript_28025/m.40115 type:complete len:348 (+) Transcript_28025:60-1103(+)